jgi:phosphoserine aminotransferase
MQWSDWSSDVCSSDLDTHEKQMIYDRQQKNMQTTTWDSIYLPCILILAAVKLKA